MNVNLELLAVGAGLVVNAIAIIGFITKNNVRLESRITRLETSLAFLLHLMKVNLAQHDRKDDGD